MENGVSSVGEQLCVACLSRYFVCMVDAAFGEKYIKQMQSEIVGFSEIYRVFSLLCQLRTKPVRIASIRVLIKVIISEPA